MAAASRSTTIGPTDGLTASGYRVREAAAEIEDTFLLMDCGKYRPLPFATPSSVYLDARAPAPITAYANSDAWSRDNVIGGADGLLELRAGSRGERGPQGVEIGYAMFAKAAVLPLLT